MWANSDHQNYIPYGLGGYLGTEEVDTYPGGEETEGGEEQSQIKYINPTGIPDP